MARGHIMDRKFLLKRPFQPWNSTGKSAKRRTFAASTGSKSGYRHYYYGNEERFDWFWIEAFVPGM
jgi:hypothetical protein